MKGNNSKYHIYFFSWLVWHLACIACRSIISAPSGKLLYQTFFKQHFIGLGWQYYSFKTLRARKKNIDTTEPTFAIHDQYHSNLKLGSNNLLLRSVTVNLNSQPYMESLKWPASYLVSLLYPCRPLVRNSTSRYARLTHCRQLGGTREWSSQCYFSWVSMWNWRRICQGKSLSHWKNYVPPFFQIHRETFCDIFQWNSNLQITLV